MPDQSTRRCLLPHLGTNNDRLYQQMNNVMQALHNKNVESTAAEDTSFVPFSSFSAWTLPPPLILRWSLFFQRYLFSQNPYNEQDPGTGVASTIKKMHENRAQRETNKKVLKEGFTSWVFREPSRVRVRNTVSNANKWQDSWIFHNQRQSIPRLTIWIQDYISTRNRWPSLSTSSKTTNTQISIING